MTDVMWVLTAWAVIGSGLVLWFGDALAACESPRGRRRDPTACTCCGHHAVAHERAGPGTSCTQCPCNGLRRAR